MSRRDGAIVAWPEVPGQPHHKSRFGVGRVGVGGQVQETVHYIEQQLEHHRTRTFQEEYLDNVVLIRLNRASVGHFKSAAVVDFNHWLHL
jgi:hypothetical protein